MLIRFFVYSSSLDEAKMVVEELFQDEKIIEMSIVNEIIYNKIENYWKIDTVYEIEVNIILSRELTAEEKNSFLDVIASKWEFFGNPIDEALTSENMENLDFIRDNFSMVNVFF